VTPDLAALEERRRLARHRTRENERAPPPDPLTESERAALPASILRARPARRAAYMALLDFLLARQQLDDCLARAHDARARARAAPRTVSPWDGELELSAPATRAQLLGAAAQWLDEASVWADEAMAHAQKWARCLGREVREEYEAACLETATAPSPVDNPGELARIDAGRGR
jgi:hypothetical protein